MPAEAATTPLAQPFSPSAASLAAAPRTLKEPALWRFGLKHDGPPHALGDRARRERRGAARGVRHRGARGFNVARGDRGLDGGHTLRLQRSPARGIPLDIDELGTADLLLRAGAALAEGPRWDARTQRLLWVDIDGHALHEYDPATGEDGSVGLPAKVGAAAPTVDPARVLVALADRLAIVDLATGDLVRSPRSPTGARACAPTTARSTPPGASGSGRCADDEAPDLAALYRFDPDGSLTTMLEDVSLSNGLAWTADERRMYYVDSPTLRIDALDYDNVTGAVETAAPSP